MLPTNCMLVVTHYAARGRGSDAPARQGLASGARFLCKKPLSGKVLTPPTQFVVRVGMPSSTLRVGPAARRTPGDAERPGRHSHGDRGNEVKTVRPMNLRRESGGDRRQVSNS